MKAINALRKIGQSLVLMYVAYAIYNVTGSSISKLWDSTLYGIDHGPKGETNWEAVLLFMIFAYSIAGICSLITRNMSVLANRFALAVGAIILALLLGSMWINDNEVPLSFVFQMAVPFLLSLLFYFIDRKQEYTIDKIMD